MYVDTKHQYMGPKAKIGGIMFAADCEPKRPGTAILVCAGYCPRCKGKVAMDYEEARAFAYKFHRPGIDIKQRFARRAIRMLERTAK